MLATGHLDIHCRIKESSLIKVLKPSLNEMWVARNFFTAGYERHRSQWVKIAYEIFLYSMAL